jgi:CheY-like chemotaxis protein
MTEFERSPRVLVVEDDDAIAQVLQRSLRMEGYEVRVAEDGVEALDEAHGFLPDLVILDLGLPRLDGIEVAKKLRETDDVDLVGLELQPWNGQPGTAREQRALGTPSRRLLALGGGHSRRDGFDGHAALPPPAQGPLKIARSGVATPTIYRR